MASVLLSALVYSVFRPRSVKKRRMLADRTLRALQEWATDRDWQVIDGIDMHFAEIADQITALVGVPRDWAFIQHDRDPSRDDPTIVGSTQKWTYGPILVRRVAAGDMVIIDSWPHGDGSHHVFAALATDGVFSPYTMDLSRSQSHRIYVQGTAPRLQESFELRELFAGLPRPIRLRLVNQQILLYVRAALSPALVDDIFERLHLLDRQLPHRPDGGPMR